MTTRKTYTPAQMRELAAGRGSQFLMDDMRGALLFAADLIEAADAVIEESRRAIKPVCSRGCPDTDVCKAVHNGGGSECGSRR